VQCRAESPGAAALGCSSSSSRPAAGSLLSQPQLPDGSTSTLMTRQSSKSSSSYAGGEAEV
jgi:hypothetical protein